MADVPAFKICDDGHEKIGYLESSEECPMCIAKRCIDAIKDYIEEVYERSGY